jgi:hypothetical protein
MAVDWNVRGKLGNLAENSFPRDSPDEAPADVTRSPNLPSGIVGKEE